MPTISKKSPNVDALSAVWQVHARRSPVLLEHLLLLRGLTVKDLEFNFSEQLHDPFLLPDMEPAVSLIEQAVKENWHITVFGDYDADGTPAAALLQLSLERLGLSVTVVLPTRETGYGLRKVDVEKAAKASQLLITVDTGITAVDEVALAKELGMKVIILDHHLPKEKLPQADAVIDPFRSDSQYPFNYLCGCALAYKFIVACQSRFPENLTEGFVKWLLDMVAISTVADMMHMVGENRVLVHYGLKALIKTKRPGLQELMKVSGLTAEKITPGSLGYVLGPRLNASGRLGDNRMAFELLITNDSNRAKELAAEIEQRNRTRQQIVKDILEQADKILFTQNSREDRCFVVVGSDWSPGVVGLVAGKIAAQYNRPVIVLTGNETLTGSARSVGNYSIIDGLTASSKSLTRFGGHNQAAGLSLPASNLSSFVSDLKAHADSFIKREELRKVFKADAFLTETDISLKTINEIEKLQPFGYQNSQPSFIIRSALLGEPKRMGASKDHCKWRVQSAGASFDVIGFGFANRYDASPLVEADLLGLLESNLWNGNETIQFRLQDFRLPNQEIETIKN